MMRFVFSAVFSAFAFPALANPACAVCTIAVGASLEIARRLGVADTVIGVWFGAFLILMFFWLVKWFDKKNWNFTGRNILLFVLTFSLAVFLYVDFFGPAVLVYSPQPILIFYLDPFLFSTLLGAGVLYYSSEFYQWMKRRNGGHAHFPFEKVVVPIVALGLLSAVFYYYPMSALPVGF
ncbi:MAG: hypothetical protein ACI4PW_01810 [Alphaproteobacteria bacterium]|jgi:hypothetical protein